MHEEVDVQNPLPSDGDSIYIKDLDLARCDNGNFEAVPTSGSTGSVADYFNSLTSINVDTTSNNPKTIKLWFKRTIYSHSIGFGCDNLGKGFGNSITIKLLGSGESVRATYNFTVDNPNSFLARFGTPTQDVYQPFNGIIIEFNTANEVCLSNLTIQKSRQTNTSIFGVSEVTGQVESVNLYKKTLQVDEALVHEVAVNKHFYRESGANTTLTNPVSSGDVSFIVDSATGIIVGDELILRNDTHESAHHLDVVGVSGTTVTVNRPIDKDYIAGDSVIEVSYALNSTAGTLVSPLSYKIEPLPGERFQITRLLITMLDQTAMDLAKFGGITALTNGVVIRGFIDGAYRTYTHWQANSDLADDMYDVNFPDKAPAGFYSLAGRWTFTNGQFVVDLDGDNNDYLEVLIQDDLTDLDDFNIKGQGRIFGQ